ncbi:MAG: ribose 5-phosphate isomerase B [Vicinamibacterales bacterium]|nr:ribose 5-phosphate isomerase B [Vicinamibacterales bacterium]
MHVAIASDHAGFALKEDLKRFLDELQVPYDDLGPSTDAPVDYPDFAAAVSRAVLGGHADRGILICGTGIGMSIAANKIPGIRAALLTDEHAARLSRRHNNANVMAVGGRITTPATARAIVRAFLDTAFEGGRHQQRLDGITRLESSPDQTRTDPS